MSRDQILDRARELADAILPDPSVIHPSEDALTAADECVVAAELECSGWGETLDYRGRPPCPEEQLGELRAALVKAVARRILRYRLECPVHVGGAS